MRPSLPGLLLVPLLLATVAVAGCLGGDDPPGLGPADGPEDGALSGGPRLTTEGGEFPLEAWTEAVPAGRVPDAGRLVQLDHRTTDQGALRWLSDGASFVFLVDQSVASYPDGTVLLLHVTASDGGFTVARDARLLSAGDAEWTVGDRSAFYLQPHEPIRFANAYTYEVLLLVPDPEGPFAVADRPGNATGTDETWRALAPRASDATAWNGTLLTHWTGPFSFRPTWDLAFTGPAEGTDRPDALEDPLLGGPETGNYTVTLSGSRIWFTDLRLEFTGSRIVGTDPMAGGNGSEVLNLQVDGYHPVTHYLDLPPERGLEQSFRLEVEVDYETRDDLQQPERQDFFYTVSVAYRHGPSAYEAGTEGRTIGVAVSGSWA